MSPLLRDAEPPPGFSFMVANRARCGSLIAPQSTPQEQTGLTKIHGMMSYKSLHSFSTFHVAR